VEPNRSRLSTFASLAEIVAALAVVVSLLHVASQVRRNTEATQAASYQAMVRASNEYLLSLASDATLADIVHRAKTDTASLTPAEGRRYFAYVRVFWRNMDNAYVQHERGVLADSEWEVYRGIACAALTRHPSWSWALHADSLSPGFVEIMNGC
jgi:hypothetical protein